MNATPLAGPGTPAFSSLETPAPDHLVLGAAAILKSVVPAGAAPSMACLEKDGCIVMHRADDPDSVARLWNKGDDAVWFRSLADFDHETQDEMVWGMFRKTMDRFDAGYLGCPRPAPEMRWDLRSDSVEIARMGFFRVAVSVCRYHDLGDGKGLTDLYQLLGGDDVDEAGRNAVLWGVYRSEIARAVSV